MNFHFTDAQFHHNPVINSILQFFVCVTLTLVGTFGGEVSHILNTPIPIGLMNLFQILAWASAFGLFLVGLYKLIRESKDEKKG